MDTEPSQYNDLLDGDTLHVDDFVDGGLAINAVRYIIPDYEAVARRNIAEIDKNIRLRKEREAKQGMPELQVFAIAENLTI